MSIIENAKEVVDLIKAAGNSELYQKIVELEDEIIELTRHNRLLEEKVEEQKRLLDLKGKMNWEKPIFRMEGEEDPYCPVCWEGSQKTCHLFKGGRTYLWFCKVCKINTGRTV